MLTHEEVKQIVDAHKEVFASKQDLVAFQEEMGEHFSDVLTVIDNSLMGCFAGAKILVWRYTGMVASSYQSIINVIQQPCCEGTVCGRMSGDKGI